MLSIMASTSSAQGTAGRRTEMQTQGRKATLPRRWFGAAGLLGAGLLAGGILAGSHIAGAASSSTGSTSSSAGQAASSSSSSNGRMDPATMTHGPGETLLTDGAASRVTAAAKAAVPGATVIRVETDSAGAAYEAHMRKADGSYVTVKLDSNFKVTGTESGFGGGPPNGPGSSQNGSSTGA
jgi:hypothetical protein